MLAVENVALVSAAVSAPEAALGVAVVVIAGQLRVDWAYLF